MAWVVLRQQHKHSRPENERASCLVVAIIMIIVIIMIIITFTS